MCQQPKIFKSNEKDYFQLFEVFFLPDSHMTMHEQEVNTNYTFFELPYNDIKNKLYIHVCERFCVCFYHYCITILWGYFILQN